VDRKARQTPRITPFFARKGRGCLAPWRREGDSNPRYGLTPYNGLANRSREATIVDKSLQLAEIRDTHGAQVARTERDPASGRGTIGGTGARASGRGRRQAVRQASTEKCPHSCPLHLMAHPRLLILGSMVQSPLGSPIKTRSHCELRRARSSQKSPRVAGWMTRARWRQRTESNVLVLDVPPACLLSHSRRRLVALTDADLLTIAVF
jgi:hypothetical protein